MLDFVLYLVTVAALYGLLALSLNLQAGVSGLLNFGHVAFFGVGAYASGIVALQGGNWMVGIFVGVVASALLGPAIGRLGRTLAADYWAIVTLAIAECLRLIVSNQDSLTGGHQGISGIVGPFSGLSTATAAIAWLVLCLLLLVAAYFFAEALTRMQFGRVLRLIREQPTLAASLGHDITRRKMRLLAVAGPIAAIAGSLYTLYISYIGPDQLLPIETFLVFTMLIIGGMGNNRGAVIGALLVQLLYAGSRFLKDWFPIPDQSASSIRVLIVGLVLTAFLLTNPAGMFGEKLRRVDVRH
ncbi:branched-chain amino acid ABC transporter permease [Micromonospora sp. NBC_00389]|uniref:branched-chain amino acid ABC transporter permease n=1 Tax=Micromonospora sp. NBC_00389 TaxID=2903586 RepID=UPI002E22C95A